RSTRDGMSELSSVCCQLLAGNVGCADAAQFAVSAATGGDSSPAARATPTLQVRCLSGEKPQACAARFSSQRSDYLFSASRNPSTVIPAFAIRLRNVPRAISE